MKKLTGRIAICKNCGKEVYIPPNRFNSFKFCSRRCIALFYRIKHNSICAFCGNTFEHSSSRANKAKYCSRKCYYKSQHLKGSIEVACKNCGKIFRTSPSHKRVFCTRECKREYQLNSWSSSFSSIQKNFRKRGFMTKCQICGYSEHPEILGIHHIDRNHDNNVFENLQVLCPNCHSLKHKHHIVHGGIKNAS